MDIIIIDDDPFMKKVFHSLFKHEHINIEVFENPVEGLEAISMEKPKCAIVDYRMPALNGDDLIIQSSQKLQFQHTDFVMITGEHFGELDRMKLMTLGFQYIFKKSDLKSKLFIDTIKEIVAQKEQKAA